MLSFVCVLSALFKPVKLDTGKIMIFPPMVRLRIAIIGPKLMKLEVVDVAKLTGLLLMSLEGLNGKPVFRNVIGIYLPYCIKQISLQIKNSHH